MKAGPVLGERVPSGGKASSVVEKAGRLSALLVVLLVCIRRSCWIFGRRMDLYKAMQKINSEQPKNIRTQSDIGLCCSAFFFVEGFCSLMDGSSVCWEIFFVSLAFWVIVFAGSFFILVLKVIFLSLVVALGIAERKRK